MNSEPRPDARTTPRWLQVPGLLLLLALTAYLGLCYASALGKDRPDWLSSSPHALWPGTWQMFTKLDKRHSDLTAEALLTDGRWVPVPLEELFPTRWESGYRYSRSSFRKSRSRMRVLSAATCGRLPDRPESVRFTLTQWGKTLGDPEQEKRRPKVREVITWDCSQPVRLPQGTRL